MSTAKLIAQVIAAFCLVSAGMLGHASLYPARAADVQPTPPPVRDLTPASPAPPPDGISHPNIGVSTCTGWYLQKEYAYSWPAATTWWENECQSYDPACWPTCEIDGNASLLIDFYYWDGSTAILYGEQQYMDWSASTTCQYWWDGATGLRYQYDTPACPWTGPGNAAPYPSWRLSCSDVYHCTFDATDSFASDGIASYSWGFGDGTTGQGSITHHTYTAVGRYPVTLTVTDNGGLVAEASGTLQIDVPPIATFTYTCAAWTCTFDGSASSDLDGTVQQYYWNFGDSPSGAVRAGSIAQHTYTQTGSYNVSLAVVDNAGLTSYSPIQVLLISGPNPDLSPIASFTVACTTLRCHFDPSASIDPDGSIVKFDWTYVDVNNAGSGTGYYTPTPLDITLPHAGSWVITLTVTDNLNSKGSASQTVTVSDLPPTAAFTSTCSALVCTFDASASADSDGSIASYSWTFGDGASSAAGPTDQHSYAHAGTYTVSLSVTDDAGLVGAVSKSITVVATIPTASFNVTCAGGTCTFDAGGSTDAGGTIAAYGWTFGDGTNGQGKVVQHTYSAAGTYSATLTVTDSGGVTAAKTKTATAIILSAIGSRVKGQRQVALSWVGSTSATFDVYRDGVRISTTSKASYTDVVSKAGAYTYKVCEAGSTSMCSNSLTVNLS